MKNEFEKVFEKYGAGGMRDSFNDLDEQALKAMQGGWPVDSIIVQSFYNDKRQSNQWTQQLPFLKFKPDWEIKVIPPTVTALIKFLVRKENAKVSVYFDSDNRLGYMSKPYWEIYPFEDDVGRYFLGEEEQMLEDIEKSLNEQLKEDNYEQ